MQAKNQLHELICAMSQSEKRYFKVFAKRHVIGGENNYVRLFEVLNKMKSYEEGPLLEVFGQADRRRQLSYYKNYLYQLLLKSLRAYHEQRDVTAKLQGMLANLKILRRKKLFTQCQKVLKKAKAMAIRHEKKLEMLQLLEEERVIGKEMDKQDPGKIGTMVTAERKEVMAALEWNYKCLDLHDELFWLVRKGNPNGHEGFPENILRISDKLGQLKETASRDFNSQIPLRSSLAKCAQLLGHWEEAHSLYMGNLRIWEAKSTFKEENPYFYLRCLANCLSSGHMVDRFSHFPSLFERIEAVPPLTAEITAEKFSHLRYHQLLMYLSQSRLEEARALVGPIEQGIEKYGKLLNKSRILAFQYNLALVFFFLSDWKASLAWLNVIFNDQRNQHRLDIQAAARLIHLMVHLELGNEEFLGYRLRSVIRYLQKRGDFGEFERTVLDTIQSMIQLPPIERMELLSQLAPQFHVFASMPGSKRPACAFEIDCWVRSKIQNQPLGIILADLTESHTKDLYPD